jgi:hypothetical protein
MVSLSWLLIALSLAPAALAIPERAVSFNGAASDATPFKRI